MSFRQSKTSDEEEKNKKYDPRGIMKYLLDEKEKCERDLDFSWLTSTLAPEAFKLLLVFPRNDSQSQILAKVARKLNWKVAEARTTDDALDLFHFDEHDLVIIDRRSETRAQQADEVCRLLIENNIPKIYNIVGLVKRVFFTAPDKNETAVLQLLSLGYSRAIMECSNEGILMNELIGMHSYQTPPISQLSAAQLMYLSFELNWMIIIITSANHNILFANQASEKLGYKREEIIHQYMEKFISNPEMNNIKLKLIKKKDYRGEIFWNKKEDDQIKLNLMIISMSLPANKCVYHAYFFDPIITENKSDSMAEERRRSSIFRDLPLEAPITKIITLLTTAMSQSEVSTVNSHIESALRLLKYVELHKPQLTEENRETDPIVENMLDSLVSNLNDRRSAVSFPRRSVVQRILVLPESKSVLKLIKGPLGPPELESLLETTFDWDFDIFKLEEITDRRPLYYAGIVLMGHFSAVERLQCDDRTLRNWLTVLEANYNSHVEYHNSTHATDVMQALARFMRSDRLKMLLEPLDEVASLIAAAAHDVGHPGRSSQFLCNGSDRLALMYNDLTVLESHHAALTFKLTLASEEVNIFKNLSREGYRYMRSNIIDMILATEMTKHFEHLAKFVNVCSTRVDFEDNHVEIYTDDSIDTNTFLIPENLTMTKRMIIKCADVSNPSRPIRETVEWTRRIAIEYFDQTDEEKSQNWPVMNPMFDRATCSIPKSQIGFIDYIIRDMMEAWDAFIDMPELVGNMNRNYGYWKAYEEEGIRTLEDVINLQNTAPELKLYKKTASQRDSRGSLHFKSKT